MKTDLHIHSTASDGTWTPEILIKKIVESEIKIFTVTDHDTTENVSRVAELAVKNNLKFVPGVEFSTFHKQHVYHILGLGIDISNRDLQNTLEYNRQATESMNSGTIDYLAEQGHPVSQKAYLEYVNDRKRGGWKALNYIVDCGLCKSHVDFFPLFKKIGNPLSKADYISPPEAIEVIKKAGGFPILAHPGASFYDPDYKKIIDLMFRKGVMGIECYHPENNEEVREYILKFCKKNDLMITGGSDCHGDFVKTRALGKPDIDSHQLDFEPILESIRYCPN